MFLHTFGGGVVKADVLKHVSVTASSVAQSSDEE
jgi:hypothetical protein